MDDVAVEFLQSAASAAGAAEELLLEVISGERTCDCVAGAELLALLERAVVLVKCSVRIRPAGATR